MIQAKFFSLKTENYENKFLPISLLELQLQYTFNNENKICLPNDNIIKRESTTLRSLQASANKKHFYLVTN